MQEHGDEWAKPLILLELTLIGIKLLVLADCDVSVEKPKCQANDNESGSENMFVNDDRLGVFIRSHNNKYSNTLGIFLDLFSTMFFEGP